MVLRIECRLRIEICRELITSESVREFVINLSFISVARTHTLDDRLGDGYYNLQKQPSTNSGNGGNNVVNSEGYSYVDEVPSLQSSHYQHTSSSQHKSTSSASHREYQQQNRTRRTQRRVTHNEKRYHSGQCDTLNCIDEIFDHYPVFMSLPRFYRYCFPLTYVFSTNFLFRIFCLIF